MAWKKFFAPATVANFGPGFDVLGLAINGLGDTVLARKIDSGVVISEVSGQDGIPLDAGRNTAGIGAREALKLAGAKGGVELKIKKGIPAGSGLGSSASSACAGAFAANALYGNALTKEQLIHPATLGEEFVSGAYFADNTAPCLLGGATIVRNGGPLDVTKLGCIEELVVVVAVPKYKVLTRDARKVVPQHVPLKSFVHNMANAAIIAAAFAKNDYSLLSKAIDDVIVEPARKHLIPGFDSVKKSAIDAGADGCSISGSGPTMFAITNSREIAPQIGGAMKEAFQKSGREAQFHVCGADMEGVREID
ncbi:MAG: homoserine kinase [archaeon]|nr:homoserine kinase [archaeon]